AKNRDVLGVYREGEQVQIFVMKVRDGVLSQHGGFFFKSIESPEETLSSFIDQYYDAVHKIPSEILVALEPAERGALEEVLGERAAVRVRIQVPRRGEKRDLLRMAEENAAAGFRSRQGK